MDSLRKTAISPPRLDGHDSIEKALRHHACSTHTPVKRLLT